MYVMTIGEEKIPLYLKNGYDLDLNFDIPEGSNEQVVYSGIGAETNKYLIEKRNFFMSSYADPNTYFQLEEADFKARISEAKIELAKSEIDIKKVDSTVVDMVEKSNQMMFSYIENNYQQIHTSAVALAKGKPSPVFENYENFKGGTTSLSDLKGKYVYIDIWATWCGPCKREIPSLKALEQKFEGKNIEFVSISVDNVDGRRGSRDSWLQMVKNEQLGGIQLFADNDFNSQFVRAYGINSIPRFILVDPNGNIVEANAMRPSDPNIATYLQELGI
ncbi:TlpA family protein disulfide reductase [Lutibacter sp. HS1-25]|nr:TlpA family protein disulfide reductase [Lutibacter sp. HS1-25]